MNILIQLSNDCDEQDILTYAEPAFNLAVKLNESPVRNIAKSAKNGIAGASNNLGFVYRNRGDIPKALDWYHKSLNILEEINDLSGIAISLNNLGNIYADQGDNLKALEYYRKSLKMREKIGDKQGIATSFNNIGLIYKDQGDTINALDFFDKSLKLREEIGYKPGIATSLHNIAVIYNAKRNLKKAIELLQSCLKIREEIGDKKSVAYTLNSIGGVYFRQWKKDEEAGKSNKLDTAMIYCRRSLEISRQLAFPENIRNSSEMLYKIFKAKGTSFLTPSTKKTFYLAQSLEMHELFKQMADSINNVETRKSGLKKQMQYTFEKKEAETKAEQEKKDIIANEELQKQKVVRNSFIGGFTLVLILALVVFRSYCQKQKANIEITGQKHVIEEKQKEILDSIHYAKRIQTALITNEKYIEKSLNKLMPN